MQPRGIRNCNPLSIRRNPANRWRGLRPVQNDPQFCQFTAMKWGLRAALKLLRTYRQNYNLNTPRQIITRWAPDSENDTAAYVQQACAMAHLEADKPLRCLSETFALLQAMSWIESRYKPTIDELTEAMTLI